MKKNISTQELKSRIGEIVDAVNLRGDRYIVERRGKPLAALVPLEVHENDERSRRKLFDLMDGVARRNRHIPEEELEAIIDQAKTEVRRAKHEKRKRA